MAISLSAAVFGGCSVTSQVGTLPTAAAVPGATDGCVRYAEIMQNSAAAYGGCMIASGYWVRLAYGGRGLPILYSDVSHPKPAGRDQAASDVAACLAAVENSASPEARAGTLLLQTGGLIPQLFAAIPERAMEKDVIAAFVPCLRDKGYTVRSPVGAGPDSRGFELRPPPTEQQPTVDTKR